MIEPAEAEAKAAPDATACELPLGPDPLDLFFRGADADGTPVPDLLRRGRAPSPATRRAAIAAARDEIRRVLMGYDVNPERGEKLAAFLEAPLPDGLSEAFRWELAEIRHELTLFADVEQLFVRAPSARRAPASPRPRTTPSCGATCGGCPRAAPG